MRYLLSFCFCVVAGMGYSQDTLQVFTINGQVHFKSDAPLELIEAESDALKGLIDFYNQTFAFTIPVNSFKGFNSALQKEHFNENYMESDQYPRATFAGKMIEKVDISQPGEYIVRAKGKLTIHGVEQERIIRATIRVVGESISIQAAFSVLLQEHNITIPKVVQHKIAEEIFVDIRANGLRK